MNLNDLQYAENPQWQGSGKFTADNIVTVTATELIAAHGTYRPSVQNSQKKFNAITVILSTKKLNNTALETISKNLENFARKGAPGSYWGQ